MWTVPSEPEELRGFRGCALVARAGVPVLEACGGAAAPDSPCRPETRFQLASVSKQFTAAAVMCLVEAGGVSLSDRVGRWLGGCPPSWDGITLHHLLSNTSGLGHWDDHEDTQWETLETMSPEGEIRRFQAHPPLFHPGSRFRYSSPGWVLLAHVVQRVGGRPYGEFLTKNVLEPAGLTETFVGEPGDRRRVALGYKEGRPVGRPDLLGTVYIGAGDVSSTVGDLARWCSLIGSAGDVVSAESWSVMLTRHVALGEAPGELISDNAYGYGLFLGNVGGRRIVYHTGDNPGFKTLNARLPDDDLTIVVLSNDEATDMDAVASRLLSAAIG